MRHQRGTTTVSETDPERAKTKSPSHRDPENPRNQSKSSQTAKAVLPPAAYSTAGNGGALS